MDYPALQLIKSTCLPLPGTQQFRQIYPKSASHMYSSSAANPARKKEKLPRLNQPTNTGSPPQDMVERADVDCWTCRRRHIRCDRIISPTGCNKCAKKPVQCLGYQKPLRWADGVAVRGKFKGKSQPVVDSEFLNLKPFCMVSLANIDQTRSQVSFAILCSYKRIHQSQMQSISAATPLKHYVPGDLRIFLSLS
jgi:hypothetical protein